MSSNGQYQTAVHGNGQIYTSSNTGVTWVARNTAIGNKQWRGISMSSSGQYQTAAVSLEFIYTSTDFGVTWVVRNTSFSVGTRGWLGIAMSSNGIYQTAMANNNYIHTSNTLIDISVNNIAIYDTSSIMITPVGSNNSNGTNNTVNTIQYDASNQLLYVGGNFTTTSDASNTSQSSNDSAVWNLQTNRWSRFGSIISNGTNSTIRALVYNENKLYVAGDFTSISGESFNLSSNRLGIWNTLTNSWSLFGIPGSTSNGINSTPYAIALNPNTKQIYVGGDFTTVYDSRNTAITANKIVTWDLSRNQWAGLGGYSSNGTNSYVYASAYDSVKNVVYCGGSFTIVYDSSNIQLTANNIAVWNINGQYWSTLGLPGTKNGTNSSINTLVMDSSNQKLYVGGYFTGVKDGVQSDISANYIAIWDASLNRWATIGRKKDIE
jgi:hypothetical protein